MSTKSTRRYVDTEYFGLHLYDDFAKEGGISIRVGKETMTFSLTQEEIDEIDKQLEE